jgi:hypothetical protein
VERYPPHTPSGNLRLCTHTLLRHVPLKISNHLERGNVLIELVLCMAMCLINGNACGSEVEPSRSGSPIVYVF